MYDNEKNYKYKDLPLSPNTIVEIILEEYRNDNKIYERKDIITNILDVHIKNGGVINETNYTSQVKKALQNIDKKFIKNPRSGFWQFNFDAQTKYDEVYNPHKKIHHNNIKGNIIEYSNSMKEGWIYFYYFPTYLKYSELKGDVFFPIKIGKSQNDPKFRVSEQSGTSLPESPVIFMKVLTENCSALEKHIHSYLELREKRYKNSIGKEWFYSNINECISLIENMKLSGINLSFEVNDKINKGK